MGMLAIRKMRYMEMLAIRKKCDIWKCCESGKCGYIEIKIESKAEIRGKIQVGNSKVVQLGLVGIMQNDSRRRL